MARPTPFAQGTLYITGGATSANIPLPAGLLAGDLLVVDTAIASAANIPTVAGATEFYDANPSAISGYGLRGFYRALGPSDSSTNVAVGNAGGAKRVVTWVVWRSPDAIDPLDFPAVTSISSASSFNRVTGTAVATQADVVEVVVAANMSGTTAETGLTMPAGITELLEQLSVGASGNVAIALGTSGSTPIPAGTTLPARTVTTAVSAGGATAHYAIAPATSQTITRPSSDDLITGYTPSTGATAYGVLSDSSTSTYVSSANNPTGQEVKVGFAAIATPGSPNKNEVYITESVSAAATSTSRTVKLYEGATVRATRVLNNLLTTSPVTIRAIKLTPAEVASITSWADVSVGVAPTVA